jgi:hypothetical protein
MAITTLATVKLVLGITGTTKDAQITALIPIVESQYLAIRRIPFKVDENDDIVYPAGAEAVAIKMIDWQMNNTRSYGKNSESLGDYSVTYDTNRISEYPTQITNMIEKYIIHK